MNQIHEGLEPWDWEKPETVEERTDPKNGVTDYFSTTSELRAQQSLHDKEQRRLTEQLETDVAAFEAKTIETVEDTYWIKNQYKDMVTRLNLMDEGEKRGELLERVDSRYEEFSAIIGEMQQSIALYEKQKAREDAQAQKRAEEAAEKRRAELEVQTRKTEFLTALQDVENLEYQAPNAQELAQTAIDKLPLVADYEEAVSYSQRLTAAIERIETLPTSEEWQKVQEEKAAQEAREQAATEQQIAGEQVKLQSTLDRAKTRWSYGGAGSSAGPGASGAHSATSPAGGASTVITSGMEGN